MESYITFIDLQNIFDGQDKEAICDNLVKAIKSLYKNTRVYCTDKRLTAPVKTQEFRQGC